MSDNQQSTSVNQQGHVNIFEQIFCIQCDEMVLKHNRCADPNKCLNYIKAEFKREDNSQNG